MELLLLTEFSDAALQKARFYKIGVNHIIYSRKYWAFGERVIRTRYTDEESRDFPVVRYCLYIFRHISILDVI